MELKSIPIDPGLAGLYEQKTRKLEEQKLVSEELNHHLTREGGLNENSRLARKNLVAAISVSQKPGYFEYHSTPSDVKEVEDTKVLNKLARRIEKLGRELDQINAEIEQASVKKSKPVEMQVSSIADWFQTYGRPSGVDVPDQVSTFTQSKKIWGGTAHHRSFKTMSASMKVGLVTR